MVKFMQLLNRDDVAAHTTPQQILDGKSIREWLTEPVYHNPTVVAPDTLLDDGQCPCVLNRPHVCNRAYEYRVVSFA